LFLQEQIKDIINQQQLTLSPCMLVGNWHWNYYEEEKGVQDVTTLKAQVAELMERHAAALLVHWLGDSGDWQTLSLGARGARAR
jgi:hypothetical protein